jgi:beta-phosphoglucomutase
MVKALIFDFDGVIVLSEQARFSAIKKLGHRYNVEISDKLFKDIVGRTTNDFFSIFLPDLDADVLQKIKDDLQREYRDKIIDHVTPVVATIKFIKTYDGTKKLAVASGSGTVVLETLLKHLGIFEKFTCIIGKEHVTKHKPDPEIYTLTAKQLGCAAQDCVVIEDTVVGAQSALNANMPVIVFLNGVNNKDDFEGINISGFFETTEQLRQMIA